MSSKNYDHGGYGGDGNDDKDDDVVDADDDGDGNDCDNDDDGDDDDNGDGDAAAAAADDDNSNIIHSLEGNTATSNETRQATSHVTLFGILTVMASPLQIAGENCMRQILETVDGQTYSFRCANRVGRSEPSFLKTYPVRLLSTNFDRNPFFFQI